MNFVRITIFIAAIICFDQGKANIIQILSIFIDSFKVSSGLPQPPNCGKRSQVSSSQFVVSSAHINQFPWMAILIYKDDTSDTCSGSLIAEQWVLTAVRCLHNRPVARVRLGDWNTMSNPDCGRDLNNRRICADPYVDIAVDKAIPHPDFSPNDVYPNDIALLHLSEAANITEWIRPICLPPARSADADLDALVGSYMYIAGWGKLQRELILSKKLVEVWPRNRCQEEKKLQLNDRQFCGGNDAPRLWCLGDTGDTGAPVMDLRGKPELWFQYGVISFVDINCNIPIIASQVDAYINWIVDEIKKQVNRQRKI